MINTDSRPAPQIGVLSDGVTSPYRCVKPLWENGIEFSYISAALPGLIDCFDGGKLVINGYTFDTLFWEDGVVLPSGLCTALAAFEAAGGRIIRSDFAANLPTPPAAFAPAAPALRRTTLERGGLHIHLLFNEGADETISGTYTIPQTGALLRLDAFTGDSVSIPAVIENGCMKAELSLAPGEMIILTVNPDGTPANVQAEVPASAIALDNWKVLCTCPESAVADAAFALDKVPHQAILTFADMHDQAYVTVNGHPAGVLFHKPWKIDVTAYLHHGVNTVHLDLLGSRANRYGKPVPMGVEGSQLLVR